MKRILPLVLLAVCLCASGAEKVWRVEGQDFEAEFSLRVAGELEPGIYPLLTATRKRTVFGVVLRKYEGRRELLFSTARYFTDGKVLVTEFFHDFEPGRKYAVRIRCARGRAELFLDGKLMKSRAYGGTFLPGDLRVTAKAPVTVEVKSLKGAVGKAPPTAKSASASAALPWRVTGDGLTVKPAGKGRWLVTFSGGGRRAVLWSEKKITPARPGEHVRVRGRYKVLSSEYGSMFRMRLNDAPHRPVLTMSGDRFQDAWTQTKPADRPDRFDFSVPGRKGVEYAFNIEFYGNPQRWLLDDVELECAKIVRTGRPPREPENRAYDPVKTAASLGAMKPVAFELVRRAGRMELLLDGRAMSPVIYRRGPHYPYWTRYANFRDAGIDLCYFFAMFGEPSAIHREGVAGMWKGKGRYDFSKMAEELRVIHAINPRARVILALCLGTYPGWEIDHPDSVFMNSRGEVGCGLTTGKVLFYGDEARRQHEAHPGEEFFVCPSYCSAAFRETTCEAVTALTEFLESAPEGKIVCGIHVVGGADGQFFPPDRDATRGEDHCPAAKRAWSDYLKMIYGNDVSRLRKAWGDAAASFEDPGIPGDRERGNDNSGVQPSQRGRDHVLFTSYKMAELRLAVFRAVKKASRGRLMTGCYYPPGTAGNFHFDMMMRSPETDFLIDIRRATPAGSFLLHNKLYIGEADMRVPHCMTPIGNYLFDQPTFENIVRQTVSNIVQREGGMYHLFDIGEAYYHKKETSDFFGRVRAEHDAALADFTVTPGVGVFFDYQQLAGCSYRAADHLDRLTKYAARHVLEHSGVPFQVYSVADIFDPALKLPKIVCFPLLPEFTQEEIARLRARAREAGSVIVWGCWRPRVAASATDFAGFRLSVPPKGALSPLVSAAKSITGVKDGTVLGESYTVPSLGGSFTAFYEKPARIEAEKGDRIAAVYLNDGRPGLIGRTRNGVTEYMNGAPGAFSPEFFRILARRQGADVLSDSNDVIVLAENGILTAVCCRGGEITVNIPRGFEVASSLTGMKYQVKDGRLLFRAANDFEVQSFKLAKKGR